MKYTDPDGNEIAIATAIGVAFLATAAVLTVQAYLQTPEGQKGIDALSNAVSCGIQSAYNTISNAVSSVSSKAAEKTKNNDEITMYHYSETPPSEFKGALRANSYITPDKYATGSEAREKLAIPANVDTGEEKAIKYRYSVKVKPGEYRTAENSIPGTNIVEPLDGKKGGGTEFKSNVPLIPYECEVIPE